MRHRQQTDQRAVLQELEDLALISQTSAGQGVGSSVKHGVSTGGMFCLAGENSGRS